MAASATNPLFSWVSFLRAENTVKTIRHNYQGVLAVWRGISRLKAGRNWTGFETLSKYFSIHWLPQRTFCRGTVLIHKLGKLLWYFKATGTKTFCEMKRACEGARLAGISEENLGCGLISVSLKANCGIWKGAKYEQDPAFLVWKAEWYSIYFKKSLKYLQSITSSADMSNSRNSIFNCFAFLHLRILDLLIHTLNENLELLFRVNIFCWSGGTNSRETLVQLIQSSI